MCSIRVHSKRQMRIIRPRLRLLRIPPNVSFEGVDAPDSVPAHPKNARLKAVAEQTSNVVPWWDPAVPHVDPEAAPRRRGRQGTRTHMQDARNTRNARTQRDPAAPTAPPKPVSVQATRRVPERRRKGVQPPSRVELCDPPHLHSFLCPRRCGFCMQVGVLPTFEWAPRASNFIDTAKR